MRKGACKTIRLNNQQVSPANQAQPDTLMTKTMKIHCSRLRHGAAMLIICGATALAYAAGSSGDQDWLAKADATLRDDARRPPVEVFGLKSSQSGISFDYRVRRMPEASQVSVALAVPVDVRVTSSTADHLLAIPLGYAGLISDSAPTTTQSLEVSLDTDELGWVRGTRVLAVRMPTMAAQLSTSKIYGGHVKLQFADKEPPVTTGPVTQLRPPCGSLLRTLERLVSNPQDISRFAASDDSRIPGRMSVPEWVPTTATVNLRIPVSETQLYRVTGRDLQSSGVAIDKISPDSIHLMLDGAEQSLYTVAKGPTIKPDDSFIFQGFQNPSPYSEVNDYWLLTGGPGGGKRMATLVAADKASTAAESFRDQALVEEDKRILTRNDQQFLTILGYRWVGDQLDTSSPVTMHFDLPGLVQSNLPASAKLRVYAESWVADRGILIEVKLNDGQKLAFPMSSPQNDEFRFEIPVRELRETSNTLTVQLTDNPGRPAPAMSPDVRQAQLEIYFDNMEIEYPHAYKAQNGKLLFTSPAKVLREGMTTGPQTRDYAVSGAEGSSLLFDITTSTPLVINAVREGDKLRFTATEDDKRKYVLAKEDGIAHAQLMPAAPAVDLRSSSNRADYIIIAYPDFMAAMEPFVAARRADGHQVALVSVREVYNQFACGQETPEAIRRFVQFAARHWQGSEQEMPATFVLLVGDCTSAYRNQFRNGVINYVPTLSSDPNAIEHDRFASDQWYATAFGDDLLADVFVGRFSVNNTVDLQTVVDKNLEYGRGASGPWRNTLAFVADHSDFEKPVERVMESLPERFFLKRIFLSEQPWVDNYYFPAEVAEAKRAKVSPITTTLIRDMFNTGASLVTYFGHGSPNVWSSERVWFGGNSENSDNRMLTNRDKLAFIINMTCNSGAIDYPMPLWNVCISEDFMRTPNGGAIGCYVPSGPGVTSQHERFALELNRAYLQEGIRPLMGAFTLANWRYILDKNPTALVRMFVFLGDPALRLSIPDDGTSVSTTTTVRPGGGQVEINEAGTGTAQAFYQRTNEHGTFSAGPIQTVSGGHVRLDIEDKPGSRPTVAIMTQAAPTTGSAAASLGVPLDVPPRFRVDAASVETTGVETAGDARVVARLVYDGRAALTSATLVLLSGGGTAAGTASVERLLPGDARTITFNTRPAPGITHYTIAEQFAAGRQPLSGLNDIVSVQPFASGTSSPAEVDTSTLSINYSAAGNVLTAQVSFRVYNVSDAPLPDMKTMLVSADGASVSGMAMLPPLKPGDGATALVTMNIPETAPANQSVFIKFDPLQAVAGSTRWSRFPLTVGRGQLPHLAIPSGGVTPSNISPSDGDTVFFDVTVENRGKTPARFVNVDAFDDTTSGSPRLESRVSAPLESQPIDAASSTTFHMRWDPFRNSGMRALRFVARPVGGWPTESDQDSSRTVQLHVRSKYKLRAFSRGIAPLTQEEKMLKQIRFVAHVQNDGESPARGVKVVFYATPQRTPANMLGSVVLDEVPANGSAEATLTYKLKPGEEHRTFRPTIEAFLKGSLQRVVGQ